MDLEIGTDADGEVLQNSTDTEVQVGNEKEMVGSSSLGVLSHPDEDDKLTQNSSGRELALVLAEEPYVGQEFESEAAAFEFYSAYGMRVGFKTRVSQLTRSRRDRSIIGREFVCNKEGYSIPDKRTLHPRAPTRTGCRAMVYIKKLSDGRWSLSKFVKEHTHSLTPGQGRRALLYKKYLGKNKEQKRNNEDEKEGSSLDHNEQEKMQEVTRQLLVERKRSLAYRRQLELIFKHIEEHNENLSKRIQYIVERVKEIESDGQEHKHPR